MNDVFDKLWDTTGWVKGEYEGGRPMMPYRRTVLWHMNEDCTYVF